MRESGEDPGPAIPRNPRLLHGVKLHEICVAGDAERRLLALLCGHCVANGTADEHGKNHGTACPVCSALGALAGLVPPNSMALSVPLPPGLPATSSVVESQSVGASAAYRSRAPPFA